MSLPSLHRCHAEICDRMASAAKTEDARQQWNDLAAELRHKADVQEGLITVTPSAGAELEEAPASKDSAAEGGSEPEGPMDAALPLPPRDGGSGSEKIPFEPAAATVCKEAPQTWRERRQRSGNSCKRRRNVSDGAPVGTNSASRRSRNVRPRMGSVNRQHSPK
jgi:hypothetical protein